MDESKDYVTMCRKAAEIQSLKKSVSSKDYVYCGICQKETWLCQFGIFKKEKHTKIWLPRQDQLQEMFDWSNVDDCDNIIRQVDFFWWFCHPESLLKDPKNWNYPATSENFGSEDLPFCLKSKWEITMVKYVRSFTSMEQLWLAFVMHEKYQKTWDGSDWSS